MDQVALLERMRRRDLRMATWLKPVKNLNLDSTNP
jgi:hypothetical protein